MHVRACGSAADIGGIAPISVVAALVRALRQHFFRTRVIVVKSAFLHMLVKVGGHAYCLYCRSTAWVLPGGEATLTRLAP